MLRFGLSLSAVVFVLDQIAKWIVLGPGNFSPPGCLERDYGCRFIEVSPIFDLQMVWNRGVSFSYDQRDIGAQYRAYWRLMDHVDAVLPGRVLRVHYEQLVTHPEREVRRLLEHCRLPFEEGCLRFHENRRAVVTISSEQVRTPIYTSGADQWRHYEPWLVELKAELGDILARYP